MLHAISVKDYMVGDLITFKPDMDVLDAIHLLLEHRISGAPVVDNLGNIVGMLSEVDCIQVALTSSYYEEKGGKVEEYMSKTVKTVDADTSLVDVAEMFLKDPYRRYPVVDDNRLVGQISRRDVLRALEELW